MLTSGQFIILDKRPYKESALLLGCFSPDYGKMNFVLHGAQKLSSETFPAVDLFREVEIEFNDTAASGDLYTARSAELLTAFDAVANNPLNFKMAGRIGSFLLKNSLPGVPQPYSYDALRSLLVNLSGATQHKPWSLEQCAVIMKTTYLYENGLLPEPKNQQQSDFLENLVASGIDNSPLPDCPAEYWNSLNLWLNSLIEYHQLKR